MDVHFKVLMIPTCIALLVGGAGHLRGQSLGVEDQDLLSRVEVLEQQNRELRQALINNHSSNDTRHTANFDDNPQSADEQNIGSLVEEYLNQKAAMKIAEEDAITAEVESKGYEVGTDLAMSATWNNGLEFSSKNKDFRIHIGGRTQFDASWFSVDDNLNANPALTGLGNVYGDGVDFRRARLRFDGTMWEVVEFAVEYDVVNSARVRNAAGTGTTDHTVTAFTDLWWQINELPIINHLRIGNFKEAIGFEHLVSSRFQPFMERSFNQDSFYGGAFNGFTPGIAAFNTMLDEYGTWNIGLFKTTDNVFATNNNDGDYAVTGRATILPWYVDEGRGLLHLGASVRQASTVGDRTRFRTRGPERAGLASQWPIIADTGTIAGEDMLWLNSELAAVFGSWTLQAEYLVSFPRDPGTIVGGVVQPMNTELKYHGGYVQLLRFLTRESDHYNRKTGIFERVVPHENFFLVCGDDGYPCHGRGAWQIGARYNFLDLNDDGINGGILHDMTSGVNWFLNPNMKVQFNYSATFRDSPLANADGWIHGWGIRVAHDF